MFQIAIVSPTKHQRLYHGSARLFTVNCFIEKTMPLLADYLQRLHSSPIVQPSEDFMENARSHLHDACYRMPGNYESKVTTEVIVLYFVRMVLDENVNVRITSLIREAERLNTEDSDLSAFASDIDKMVDLARDIEACTSLEEVIARGLIQEIPFYSTMKQDVQFFGSRETALSYAKGSVNYLYAYDLKEDNYFIDIDDLPTIHTLMEPSYPFHSAVPYTEQACKYYAESYQSSIRFSNWKRLFSVITTGITIPHESSVVLYRFPNFKLRRDVPHRGYDDDYEEWSDAELRQPTRLEGEELRLEYNRFFLMYYEQQRENWTLLCRAWNVDLDLDLSIINSLLVDKLYLAYPLLETQNPDTSKDAVSATLAAMFVGDAINKRASQDILNFKLRSLVLPVLKALEPWFGIKSQVLRKLLEELQQEGDLNPSRIGDDKRASTYDDIYNGIGINTKKHFSIDFCSPRALWIVANWEALNSSLPANRYSHYNNDSLIVHSLITSDWFRTRQLAGWRCLSMGEWMIYRPGKRGKMKKIIAGYAETEETPCEPF